MNYGTLPGLDKPVSRLVQGTMMISTETLDKSFALLDSVFEQGGNAFDTAHVYGGGDCERAFGQWLQARGLRDKIVIIGKGAHPNKDRAQRVTPFDIAADLHDSLARLRTDYIDLYLLHRDDPSVPVGPIVEALNEHQRAGRIRAFGGSNWAHERIQAANEYAAQHGLMPFAASSPNFSLADQIKPPWEGCVSLSGPEALAARKWYRQQNMALITWSSLAGGFFSGRFRRDNLASFDPNDYWSTLCIEVYCSEENFQRLDRAQALAAQKSLTLPQIALAYVTSQPLNIFALTGSQTAEEFAANAQAVNVSLSPDELSMLENGTPS
jgi:aryl-alcohol dehydrogenase-like predicted oxidoreductase